MTTETLKQYGAIPTVGRFVKSDNIITAAGVSAGIDIALELLRLIYGDDMSQMVQLGIEYDPSPPFDAGFPESAPEPIVAALRTTFEATMAQRMADR